MFTFLEADPHTFHIYHTNVKIVRENYFLKLHPKCLVEYIPIQNESLYMIYEDQDIFG